jgi:lipopolysaccharide/colanic/teichoic acid biosynthesis glycosyltransferase
LLDWKAIPKKIRNKEVKKYYEILKNKRFQLRLKRGIDFILSFVLLIVLFPLILLIAILVKCTSRGPVFFRQERITKYGRVFRIFKFRTMVFESEKNGGKLTVKGDSRITKFGKVLRKLRLDELPQLLNIIAGQMSFVGTRPEVPEYVAEYTDEMKATLLMPAGLTSLASIKFKDEANLLKSSENVKKTYLEEILPKKMEYNLLYMKNFNIFYDLKLMIITIFAVLKRS